MLPRILSYRYRKGKGNNKLKFLEYSQLKKGKEPVHCSNLSHQTWTGFPPVTSSRKKLVSPEWYSLCPNHQTHWKIKCKKHCLIPPEKLEITLLPWPLSHLAPCSNWRGISEAWSVQVFSFFFLQTFFTREDHMESWPLVMHFSSRAPEPSGVKLLHLILRLIFISCKMLQVCARTSLSSHVCLCVCIERFK